jgi:hypothetical protein
MAPDLSDWGFSILFVPCRVRYAIAQYPIQLQRFFLEARQQKKPEFDPGHFGFFCYNLKCFWVYMNINPQYTQ